MKPSNFLATSSGHQTFTTGNEPIIASSGDRDFDYALAQTLSRLTDTFRVLPGFAYYDDFEQPNALATPRARMARADGTVLFGRRYLKRFLVWPEHPRCCGHRDLCALIWTYPAVQAQPAIDHPCR
jgi:hypothetical protein